MPRRLKFPKPSAADDNNPVLYVDNDRVVQHYNEANEKSAKRNSRAIRDWFEHEARKEGWGAVHFPLVFPSKTKRAGAVLIKRGFTVDDAGGIFK